MLFDLDPVLPVVAEVVDVGERDPFCVAEVEKAHLVLVEQPWAVHEAAVVGLWVAVAQAADAEFMQVGVPPVERGLDCEMKLAEVPGAGHDQAALYLWRDPVQRDAKLQGVQILEWHGCDYAGHHQRRQDRRALAWTGLAEKIYFRSVRVRCRSEVGLGHADRLDAEAVLRVPMLPARKRQVRADPRGQPDFPGGLQLDGLLPPWQRDNQRQVERIVVHDPRSLANVWVLDETTDGYIAVPTRLPRPDMTLAQSEAARQALQACKARDHTEGRLFENLAQIRSI